MYPKDAARLGAALAAGAEVTVTDAEGAVTRLRTARVDRAGAVAGLVGERTLAVDRITLVEIDSNEEANPI